MRNIWNHFFVCLRFIFTVFYTGSFQIPPEKNRPHRKWRFPLKIPIWPKSLLYKPSEEYVKTPITQGWVRTMRGIFIRCILDVRFRIFPRSWFIIPLFPLKKNFTTIYYYFHLNYLFDKAEVYLLHAYLVLLFDYFQGHGQ